eukprot:SAG31_NODE_15446_length_754_cov_1.644275_2_plen_57_part_00
MSAITQVHPIGQAITLVAKKYDLPEEVEKKIQDLVFCNRLPNPITTILVGAFAEEF